MALVVKDRVRETSATSGTGTLTLGGAVTGFQSFSSIGNANTTYYAIVDSTTGAWEVGIGTYTSSGTTLSRDTVLASSNSGSLVSFAGNTKDVFCTYPAGKSIYLDAGGNAIGLGTPAAFVATNVTGLPISTGVSGLGTGVATALAVNTGTAGAFVVNGGALGTPSSGTVTNLTGTASININGTVGATTPTTGAFTTISATGVVTVSAGSAGAPSIISTTGTSDTGQWFPAADTIAWSTAGSERMRIDSAGAVGIGATALTGWNVRVSKTMTGATAARGIEVDSVVQSDVTVVAYGYRASLGTAAAFTLGSLRQYEAAQGTLSGTVTNQFGFYTDASLISATNNYGFYGNIASGTNRWNLYMNGTASNYMAGSLGIGSTSLTGVNLMVDKNITGAVTSQGIFSQGAVQSDVTSNARYFQSTASTQNAVFTLTNLQHYTAFQGTFGASSTVTNQYGYYVGSNLTGATNNYGFYGDIASGTNRWNLYMNGTANNYLAGSLGIGTTGLTGINLAVDKSITGSTDSRGVSVQGAIQSDVTSVARYFISAANTQATSFTLSNLRHYEAYQGTFGVGSAVTTQTGFFVDATLIGATNNYGFLSAIPSGTNRWNFYASGTAANFFNGRVLIQTTANNGGLVEMGGTGASSGVNGFGISQYQSVPSSVTGDYYYNTTNAATPATAFTLSVLRHYNAGQGTFGVGSSVTEQTGFRVTSTLIGATNNYGFYSVIPSGTGRWNLYMDGTANNYMAGSLGIGTTTLTGYTLRVSKAITGAVSSFGIVNDGQVQSDVTAQAYGYRTTLGVQNATFTLPSLFHVSVEQGTYGASATVTNQYGVIIGSNLTGATNNYGFYGNIPSGTNRWNAYMGGTAWNYFAGNVGIGSVSLTDVNLAVNKVVTGAVTAYGMYCIGAVQSDVTSDARYFSTFATTQAASFTLTSLKHYAATQGTFGASSVVTNQYGFHAAGSLVSATNNFGFYSDIASSTGRWNFYAAGTAANYFGGTVTIQTASATALAVGLNGATNPAFTVDSSTASQAAGFKITGAATGGTVALVATDSGSNTSLSFNAKGTGTISVGSVSTGDMIFGGSADATRRVEITTNGLATFAYGDNSLPANITLQNLGATSTTNHGSSILWRTRTDSSATAINSGRIAVIKEQLWTSTASTQDSAMAFYVTVDGSMSERVRISSAGNVGINTNAPSYTLSVNSSVGINSYDGVAGKGRFVLGDPTDTAGYVGMYRSAAATIGTAGNDLTLGSYNAIAFTTGAAAFSSQTERMRLDSNGDLMLGATSSSGRFTSTSSSTTVPPIYANSPASFTTANYASNSATAAGTGWFHFYGVSSSNTVQNVIIYGNGDIENANNSYAAISDIKLKENIVDATPKLEKLKQVRIVNFNLKSDPGKKQIGVIAQELESIFPTMVYEVNDRDVDGSTLETKTKSVKYSVFVPMLIKAIQEQQVIIEALTTRITALESA